MSTRSCKLPWKNWDESYIVQQYMGGLKGDLSDSWKFDVYASYDSSVHDSIMHDAVLKSRVQTLLNAADGGASFRREPVELFAILASLDLAPSSKARSRRRARFAWRGRRAAAC